MIKMVMREKEGNPSDSLIEGGLFCTSACFFSGSRRSRAVWDGPVETVVYIINQKALICVRLKQGDCLASSESFWFTSASSSKCLMMKDICRPAPAICYVVQWTGPNCTAPGPGTDANGSFSKGRCLPTLARETRLNKHGYKLEAGPPDSLLASVFKSGLWMLNSFHLNIFVRRHGSTKQRLRVVC